MTRGITATSSELLPRVMVTTCKANISPPQLFLIRSYQLSPISGFGDPKMTTFSNPKKTTAWMAARCSR